MQLNLGHFFGKSSHRPVSSLVVSNMPKITNLGTNGLNWSSKLQESKLMKTTILLHRKRVLSDVTERSIPLSD